MKIRIDTEGKSFNIGIPKWLYMNSVGVSMFALRKNVPFTPKQGRKAVRAIKKVMKESSITSICEIEVIDKNDTIHISI